MSKLQEMTLVKDGVDDAILDLRRIVVRKLDSLPHVTQVVVNNHVQSAINELLLAQRQLERAIKHTRQEEANG